ncbi:putative transmembrane protein [Flavobacterium limnosediminis JC2902]|uniref:Putative transmembrane protein n=1 Tax=Flavobacterium limnosediminis JC2902 TaxID=1341181 RepID=V6SP37_9FLAO|nr:YitT family protein [Flavobacterium limnosediminis]ESU28473.1 putative transmembrane protein [Flavobacterium limnosediminis JC2902]
MNAYHNTINWKEILHFKNIFLNLMGVAFITLALKGFMIPNKFLDGGIIGVSILIHKITYFPFGVLVVLLNIPFIFLGRRMLGKTFAVQSFLTVLLIAISINFVHIEAVTSDKLLIALFGGCLIGIGMGLCIRSGSTADGIEILALLTTRKIGLNVSEVIFGLNTLIFLAAAIAFGISTALYSIVTYFAAIKSLDYIVHGLEQYTSLHIISSESDKIKSLIVKKFGKGITIIKGERGYLPDTFEVRHNCDIVVTVVTRLELLRIKNEIGEVDPNAFMYIQYIKEASGGILRNKTKH